MAQQDSDMFRKQMGDVTRLPEDDRVPAHGTQRPPSLAQIARRRAASGQGPGDPNPLTTPERVHELGPHDVVGHRKNGVQEGVFRKLRLGKYEPRGKLDLHRVTIREARSLVYDFIREAHEKSLRTVIITHGKGQHSPIPGRMKSYVFHWLEELDLVLAYHSARPQHGGAGATYVMVRKSPEARRENREAFQERPRKG
jgi:DNA-nicking Smr family endonuclease